ncbi:hypothetical protein SAMN04488082_113105 [Desulfomicrobium apsheronum]|uniref:Capsule polysaccharide biosynthesis protein n=1 Tax=Desulfomicrobium apsheronum TaxID=52560 RepID=A0A1I3WKR7_9BACT|nr:hypothetical protein [Desulfomicrobium apsheronum]SFK08128.1 hypothetical protein SAMN04488082_113105 [Desulfomicrobium apsheronum]
MKNYKIAFVENRYKTFFWESISKYFEEKGHETTWIIQNLKFIPSCKNICTIPYPQKSNLSKIQNYDFSDIFNADRSINYFKGTTHHYEYYYEKIKKWMVREDPDVVIGESTLFHELLTIKICKKFGILYINPSMVGYPHGRFSAYKYNTKEPIGHNDQIPSDNECLQIANDIKNRIKKPDYMYKTKGKESNRNFPTPNSIENKYDILRSYAHGEKYNTPSPIIKTLLEINRKYSSYKWQKKSIKNIDNIRNYKLLYPLQMQPEANLDVWGIKYRNQEKLLIEMAELLNDKWTILVKSNPKFKYEMNAKKIASIIKNKKIKLLPLETEMSDIFNKIDLFCTVTGTIAIECSLSGKPIVQLGKSILDNNKNIFNIKKLEEIISITKTIENNNYLPHDDTERINIIKKLFKTTFEGKISDPSNMPDVMDKSNITLTSNNILKIINQSL